MNLTNRYDLPRAFALAASVQRTPIAKTISVTELVKPPRVLTLERLHDHETEADVSDLLPQFFGTAIHKYLEAFAKGTFAEQTLRYRVDGWTVHGTPDSLEWLTVENGVLTDWKTTLIRSLTYEKREHECQTNLYVHLARLCGLPPIETIRLWYFLRDWDSVQMVRDPEYPRAGIVRRDLAVWPEAEAAAYFNERLRLHREAAEDGSLPECTAEDRWQRTHYALQKHGNGRATRLFDSEQDAWDFAAASIDPVKTASDWYDVEGRVGSPIRCERFCRAAPWCGQRQAELAAMPLSELVLTA